MLLRIFLVFVLLLPCAEAQSEKGSIDEIRSHFKWINSQVDFTMYSLDGEEYLEFSPDNGALLKGFYRGGKLFKMVETVGLSYALITDEYYLWDEQLFFIYHKENAFVERYDASGNFIELDYASTELKSESRYYISNGTLIKQLNKGKSLMPSSHVTDFVSKVASLREYLDSKRLLQMIQGHWVSTQDDQYTIDFKGLNRIEFYSGEQVESMTIRIDHGYLYGLSREEEPEETKYQIIGLTDSRLTLLYLPAGRLLKFERGSAGP